MVEAVKVLSFCACLKWFFLIVGICHQLERLHAGNTHLLKCVKTWLGVMRYLVAVLCGYKLRTIVIIIVNNGDDITIYFTRCFILVTWEFASDT